MILRLQSYIGENLSIINSGINQIKFKHIKEEIELTKVSR
jgi:hypothetical protein